MVFSSLTFLYIFFPVSILLYFLSPKKLRNLVLLIASLIFYAWGEPVYILLMIFSSLVDYTHGILIFKNKDDPKMKKLFLCSSIFINIGLLSFFKYGDFLINNINSIFNLSINALDLPLPIGISFYTFQTLSYTIDVYRQRVPLQKNFISFATYVTLFPQLIAGPIVRYKTVAAELDCRKETFQKVSHGIKRFILGLGKKVLIANNIGLLWNEISQSNMGELPVLSAWLGIIAFALQIYYDFSGYSDMAIGLGKIFGFTFCENFNYPYISKSISEFWRRWHMSLGEWFRDYVYFPLGGNRCTLKRNIFNLVVVWFLTGFWHGANWNFILWGLYFGIIIIIEKYVLSELLKNLPHWICHIYTILLLLVGWVLFYFEDMSSISIYIQSMLNLCNNGFINSETLYYITNNFMVISTAIICSTPLAKSILEKFKYKWDKNCSNKLKIFFLLENTSYLIIFIMCTAYLVDSSFNPFLYFRF